MGAVGAGEVMSPQKPHLQRSAKMLRWARAFLCLPLLAGLLVPALGDEKKATSKKEDKDNKKSSLKKEDKDEKRPSVKKEEKLEKQETKDKMVPLGAMVCRISRIEGAQKNITVQISHPVLQPLGRSFRISATPGCCPVLDATVQIVEQEQSNEEIELH